MRADKTENGRRVVVFGGDAKSGVYVLRIALSEAVSVVVSRDGTGITFPAGQYVYVGSGGRSGFLSLEYRLRFHASRTEGAPTQPILPMLLRVLRDEGLGSGEPLKTPKSLHWVVDRLIDKPEADLVAVYAVRSAARLEAALGQYVESLPETSFVEDGLGASDVDGNTHLMRVNAEDGWWTHLEAHLDGLATVVPQRLQPLPDAGGVYALVLHLGADREINYGRARKTAALPKGWYVCVGSAHGPGGLFARTDRHLRIGGRKGKTKKKRWHIDWVRPMCQLVEIWFSVVPGHFEHIWAQSLEQEMPGASVPVPGFAATDCRQHGFHCRSHLIHFGDQRPFTAGFRVVAEAPNTIHCRRFEEGPPPNDPRLKRYVRGREYLERYRLEVLAGRADSDSIHRFHKKSPGRALAEVIGAEWQVDWTQVGNEAKLALAVESIVENCGPRAYDALFGRKTVHKAKAIESLSRTSDVRQRHCIEAVLEGRRRTVNPNGSEGVFDTVNYAEVNSRLARAWGALRKVNPRELEQRDRPLLEALEAAVEHMLHDSGIARGFPSRADVAAVNNAATPGRNSGRIKQALAWTVKNVWDGAEMDRRGIVGTESELQTTTAHLKILQAQATELLQTGAGWTKVDKSGHEHAPDYLTIHEVAELLRVSTKTIRRRVKSGELPGFKLGGTWRFRRADIENCVEALVTQTRGG